MCKSVNKTPRLILSKSMLVSVIQNKVSLNALTMAYVLASQGEMEVTAGGIKFDYFKTFGIIEFTAYKKIENSQTKDEFEFRPQHHFWEQLLERQFDLSCLVEVYRYTLKNGECKNVEVFNGISTICFSVVGNEIQLVTGWRGKRN